MKSKIAANYKEEIRQDPIWILWDQALVNWLELLIHYELYHDVELLYKEGSRASGIPTIHILREKDIEPIHPVLGIQKDRNAPKYKSKNEYYAEPDILFSLHSNVQIF